MSKRVESEQYYVTLEMFIADVKRMFANARTYNSPETIYFKCATRHAHPLVLLFQFSHPWFQLHYIYVHCAGSKLISKAKFNQVSNLVPKFSNECTSYNSEGINIHKIQPSHSIYCNTHPCVILYVSLSEGMP